MSYTRYSILDIFLYILYTNDLPRLWDVITSLYADNTALFTSNIENKLTNNYYKIYKYYAKWVINIEKKPRKLFYSPVVGRK